MTTMKVGTTRLPRFLHGLLLLTAASGCDGKRDHHISLGSVNKARVDDNDRHRRSSFNYGRSRFGSRVHWHLQPPSSSSSLPPVWFLQTIRGGGDFESRHQDTAFGLESEVKTSRGTMTDDRLQRAGKPKHSPVVYQYYGATRSRPTSSSSSSSASSSSSTDAPHFILLGRQLERFKNVGKILASRGFDTMVCERAKNDYKRQSSNTAQDAPDLVLEILDALKWNKVVLVGCDEEGVLAMETAMMLAPEQVVGLILCGDLTDSNRLAVESGGIELDAFLHRILDCPFVIISEGGSTSAAVGSSVHILGGGQAPYQTKPEQFAWILTRFVEEKLSFGTPRPAGMTSNDNNEENTPHQRTTNPLGARGGILQNLNLPFGINSLVSPEGRLLLGRAVAAALFYTSLMKVFVVQYGILRSGVVSIKNSVDSVDALRRKVFQAVGLFVVNFGYLPRLFRVKKAKEVDEDDLEPTKRGEDESDRGADSDEVESPSSTSSSSSAAKEKEEQGNRKGQPDEESYNYPHTELYEDQDDDDRPKFKPFFFLDNIIT